MNNQLLQGLRQRLQKRIQRFDDLDEKQIDLFGIYLTQFLVFFDNEPIFVGIIDELITKYPRSHEFARRVLEKKKLHEIDNELYQIDTDLRNISKSDEVSAAMGYSFLRELHSQINIYHKNRQQGDNPIRVCYLEFARLTYPLKEIGTIKKLFLIPLYEYVEEQIDASRIFLSLLIRYKHRSEWFERERLNRLLENNTRSTEKLLALDLYSYLHDRGVDFAIEPSSITGEIDIIAAQGTEDPLLADAKVFDGDGRGSHYIKKAFNQIYTYAQQYNETFGYLIIFKNTDRDLCFSLSNQHSNIPFVTYNHKTIFLVTVDIYTYTRSVSQRNPIDAVMIAEDDLIKFVKEQNDVSDNI